MQNISIIIIVHLDWYLDPQKFIVSTIPVKTRILFVYLFVFSFYLFFKRLLLT